MSKSFYHVVLLSMKKFIVQSILLIFVLHEFAYCQKDRPRDLGLQIGLFQPGKWNAITDVDGVLTDGGMYYSEKGELLKKFNTKDGMGVELLHKASIKTIFLSIFLV